MIPTFLLLVGCQMLGDVISKLGGFLVPGPVIGMLLLLVGLIMTRRLPDVIDKNGSAFLGYIGLLFVPAGVGIINHRELLAQWQPILIASVAATILTLAITALLYRILKRSVVPHD